jgi:hypothetical protein
MQLGKLKKKMGLKMNGTHQLLVHAVDKAEGDRDQDIKENVKALNGMKYGFSQAFILVYM